MKLSLRSLSCAAFGAVLVVGQFAPASGQGSITEFDAGANQSLNWQVVNDGVMGGVSSGALEISDAGVLKFTGVLSLENNGGFASVRTGRVDLDLSGASGLIARVRGDGRTYQMRLSTDARFRGMEVSFAAEFQTQKGEWTEVSVPFSSFIGTFRGRTLEDVVLDPAKVRRVGLLLADGTEGPFSLEVDWIRTDVSGGGSLADLAAADGRFATLLAAVGAAGLVEALQGEGPLTVFAPTDEAFAKLPEGTVESLLQEENLDRLKEILTYHVVAGRVGLADALAAGEAASLQGQTLSIRFAEGRVRVGDAAVLDADVAASNGIIHVIDSVLIPQVPVSTTDLLGVARAAGSFSTLLAAIDAAGLTEVLQGAGPFTVLAPTDDAFAKLPEGTVESLLEEGNRDQLKAILTYHVIAGSVSAGDALNVGKAATVNGQSVEFAIKDGLFQVNGATIRTVDIGTDNGVIHVIDAVLLPGAQESANVDGWLTPTALIEAAVERGVPLFNSGDPAACAAIYLEALQALTGDERVAAELRAEIKAVLDRAGDRGSATQRAWLFRRTLDRAYRTIMHSES